MMIVHVYSGVASRLYTIADAVELLSGRGGR